MGFHYAFKSKHKRNENNNHLHVEGLMGICEDDKTKLVLCGSTTLEYQRKIIWRLQSYRLKKCSCDSNDRQGGNG